MFRILFGAAVAVAVLGTSEALAAKPSSPKPVVMHLISRATAINNLIDTGPAGLSSGDYYVFSDQLFAASGQGASIGYADGTCTLIEVSTFRFVCTFALVLPKGQVTTIGSGSLLPGSTSKGAITGGTGTYARARGSAALSVGSNEHKLTLTMYLS
jgi:hypothetical protein